MQQWKSGNNWIPRCDENTESLRYLCLMKGLFISIPQCIATEIFVAEVPLRLSISLMTENYYSHMPEHIAHLSQQRNRKPFDTYFQWTHAGSTSMHKLQTKWENVMGATDDYDTSNTVKISVLSMLITHSVLKLNCVELKASVSFNVANRCVNRKFSQNVEDVFI